MTRKAEYMNIILYFTVLPPLFLMYQIYKMDKVERDMLDAVQIPEAEFSVGETLLHTAKTPIAAALPYAGGQNVAQLAEDAYGKDDKLIAVVADGFARVLQELQGGANMEMNRFARKLYPYMTQAGRQYGQSLVTGGGL